MATKKAAKKRATAKAVKPGTKRDVTTAIALVDAIAVKLAVGVNATSDVMELRAMLVAIDARTGRRDPSVRKR